MPEPTPSDGPLTASHVPPPAGRSEAETLAPAAAPGGAAPPENVPGYDLLGVLGRGGMGVVYEARQVAADRVVALKMILHGGHADDDALARFRTEAKAIARLQHPHIVQVYEVGEHAGLPYFSLEFCPGGSLERKLAGTPLPATEAARLVEVLARAMHAAHREHIIHRDLKPANVLLAADGTPKVTDFGLAKKLDAAGPTQSNAVMGTPSYMAPEQAGGRGKEVGPAADVYALGAILYECLTGRPPFRGPTTLDTLVQVLSDEPVPPRQLQSTTPKDLETICLKCLHKEPGKRYATAEALAEDLRRFQAGEPILARPAGSVERAVKWIRRRPAVSALLAAAAVLAVATAGSILYAFQQRAAHQTEIANQERANTREQQRLTQAAQDESNKANAARAEVEATLARSLLRPLGHQEEARASDIELDAFWELAETSSDRVHRLFLEYALERPVTTRQLRIRRELAIKAAVGLDPARCRWLEERLLQRLQDDTLEATWRANYAWLAVEMIRPGLELSHIAPRLLADALAKEVYSVKRSQLSFALGAVAPRLDAAEAAALARRLADELAKEEDPYVRFRLAEALGAVAARLEPAEAARLCGPAAWLLADALAKEEGNTPRSRLADALGAMAPRLDPTEAAALARRLADELAKQTDTNARGRLSTALGAVAARLEPAEAARLCAQAAWLLADALAKETRGRAWVSTEAGALEAVAPRLGRSEAVAPARLLADALTKERDSLKRPELAKALGAVAARLDPIEAAASARALAGALAAKETEGDAIKAMVEALRAVAPRLDAAEAAALARRLADELAKKLDLAKRIALAKALGAVTARLELAEAARLGAEVARRLADELAKEKDPYARFRLAEALGAVAARLELAEAARLCSPAAWLLADALAKETRGWERSRLTEALDAAGARLEPAEAARLGAQVTRQLADALAKENDFYWRSQMARAHGAMTAWMEPVEATRWLVDTLDKETDRDVSFHLAGALEAVATRIEPGEVAPHSLLAARTVAGWLTLSPQLGQAVTLLQAAEPLPCRFPTQQLVDFLKMPTCVGPFRAVVLQMLGNRYRRTFADQWEFVDFAETHLPDIDLKSPPKRPRK
jgi:hypothetical protein